MNHKHLHQSRHDQNLMFRTIRKRLGKVWTNRTITRNRMYMGKRVTGNARIIRRRLNKVLRERELLTA